MQFPAEWDQIKVKVQNMDSSAGSSGSRKRPRRPAQLAMQQPANESPGMDATAVIGAEGTTDMQALVQQCQDEQHRSTHKLVLDRVDATERTAGGDILRLVQKVSANLQSMVSVSSYHSVFANTAGAAAQLTQELRPLSKKFEDSVLRQPIHAGERPCVRGEQCECMFLDPTCPFVGVELVLPWESKAARPNGERLCLPCLRATTLVLYLDILHNGKECPGLVQRFYNEHSKPGEYALQAMLIAGPRGPVQNLPMPIVLHQRSHYHVHKDNGVVYARQVNVDFR